MGHRMSVVGLKPVNDRWKKMYAVYEACENAGIAPPVEIDTFFGGLLFSEIKQGEMEVEIDNLLCIPCVEPYKGDRSEGYTVDINLLPVGVTKIRFINKY